nr:SRPBCC family protein [Actinomycetota bacterium]
DVWALVSDVTRMGEWSPENLGADWISGAAGEVGARFRGRNRRGKASWSTTCEVVSATRGRVFAFAVGKMSKPDAVWRYEFTPLPDSRSRVSESYELPRPLGRFARLVTRVSTGVTDREDDLEDGMRQTLQRLAEAVREEGGAALR